MTYYRLYLLDELNHITSAVEIMAGDDIDAAQAARSYPYGHPKEVWQGARQVWLIDPAGSLRPGASI